MLNRCDFTYTIVWTIVRNTYSCYIHTHIHTHTHTHICIQSTLKIRFFYRFCHESLHLYMMDIDITARSLWMINIIFYLLYMLIQ